MRSYSRKTVLSGSTNSGLAMSSEIQNVILQNVINSGYASDDEASDFEEPCDSGRTRSSARRAQQSGLNKDSAKRSEPPSSSEKSTSSEDKGKKRKKKGLGGDGSDSEPDEGNPKSRLCVEPVSGNEVELVCSCPKDVMKCIGILPSLPIVTYFQDSEDSDSSLNEELGHTILPTVSRNRGQEGQ